VVLNPLVRDRLRDPGGRWRRAIPVWIEVVATLLYELLRCDGIGAAAMCAGGGRGAR
jgi:hypothetical protein